VAVVARPTLLTPDVADDLVVLLAAGMSASAAARTLGLPARTVSRWSRLLRGRVEQLRGAGPTAAGALEEARLMAVLLASQDWRASAWWLERMYPERWGEREPRVIDAHASDLAGS
jgi:hypothetical protein